MAERTRTAAARPLGDGDIGVWVAFDDREQVKRIPSARWDPKVKCWRVRDVFRTDVDELIRRLNGHTSSTASNVLALPLVAVFRAVPIVLRQPTYKALSKVWHPDAGGDLRLMQELTAAWNESA